MPSNTLLHKQNATNIVVMLASNKQMEHSVSWQVSAASFMLLHLWCTHQLLGYQVTKNIIVIGVQGSSCQCCLLLQLPSLPRPSPIVFFLLFCLLTFNVNVYLLMGDKFSQQNLCCCSDSWTSSSIKEQIAVSTRPYLLERFTIKSWHCEWHEILLGSH